MKDKPRKPSTELIDCALALKNLSSVDPEAKIDELIEEGLLHLHELKSATVCNSNQIYSLEQRIRRAEDILHQKNQNQ